MLLKLKRQLLAGVKTNFGEQKHLRATRTCPKVWLGGEYSGFFVNPDLLSPESIVYSFGVGEDISFDREVISRYGCHVFAFDPTPKSIHWVGQQKLPEQFHFEPVGVGATTGSVDFYLPSNPNFVSGSLHYHQELSDKITVPMETLSDIMARLGHTKLDVLKMDIEGAEYDVLDNLLAAPLPANQLLIEFHDRFFADGIARTRDAVQRLRDFGYDIFAVSDLLQEVSFVRRDVLK
jgi:FkbM family methyltransferase